MRKKERSFPKKVYLALYVLMLVSEPGIVLWEAMAASAFYIDWRSALSL